MLRLFGCSTMLLAAIWASSAFAAPAFKSAQLQALNKVTTRVTTLHVKPLLPASFGTLDIDVKRCWHSPDDKQPEQAALIEIRERTDRFGRSELNFLGWMFASSPALSAMQHPVYDITLIRCDL